MNRSPLFTVISFLKYSFKAVGPHSLHSPFVFDLYQQVIKQTDSLNIRGIEQVRKSLLSDHTLIDVVDFKNNTNQRKTVSSIARNSLSTAKFSAFLNGLINKLECKTVLETGTSLGINSLYLSHSSAGQVITVEASPILSELAKKQFSKFSDHTIIQEPGDVNQTFETLLIRYQPDFIFLDADHRSSTILKQVEKIVELTDNIVCIVIHDIYWSKDMNQAWSRMVDDKRFMLTLDIFQAGLIFPAKGIEKQHFTLRF